AGPEHVAGGSNGERIWATGGWAVGGHGLPECRHRIRACGVRCRLAKGPAVELLWPARAMVGVLRSSPEWQHQWSFFSFSALGAGGCRRSERQV
ncbi:unnamed protein product, partial [Urochloa humidicola]